MKDSGFVKSFLVAVSLVLFFSSCTEKKGDKTKISGEVIGNMNIGWASVDITPDKPVLLIGQFPARISEGVMDPITVTALAIESGKGLSSEKAIMISCDLAFIGDWPQIKDNLRDIVRELLKASIPEVRPEQIIINATHTHTAPVASTVNVRDMYGVDLNVMPPKDYLDFLSGSIASAAEQAWKSRKQGGISFGLGQAVVGHNRLVSYFSGESVMLGNTSTPEFSHLEGFEDHSVNLLYTWDKESNLTGVVINIACPSQVSGTEYIMSHLISADFWHDTRLEVRMRLGKDVYILPQCSAAGDQCPQIPVGLKAEERMQRLIMGADSIKTGQDSLGQGHRKQIALRIADAVTSVYPYMKNNIEWSPLFGHKMEVTNLSRRLISTEEAKRAQKESDEWKKKYEDLLQKINENPELKQKPRWYSDVTGSYSMMKWKQTVTERYELQKIQPKMPVEIHVLRIGDIVIATNSFELYLDYGMRIKGRSPAIQTFIVQLTGCYNGYLPTKRSVAGDAYGAVPESTLIGPEGGKELVEKTLELINSVWQKK
jgi:hypothetical protein